MESSTDKPSLAEQLVAPEYGFDAKARIQLESKDDLKRRIDEASKYAPLEQLALSPQCGFSSTVHGNNIAVEDQRKKLALVVETAKEVWG